MTTMLTTTCSPHLLVAGWRLENRTWAYKVGAVEMPCLTAERLVRLAQSRLGQGEVLFCMAVDDPKLDEYRTREDG